MTGPAADPVEEVLRQRLQRLGLVRRADRRVRLEAFEGCFDFDLGDGEAPEGEAGKEGVPVLGRDEVGRRRWGRETIS